MAIDHLLAGRAGASRMRREPPLCPALWGRRAPFQGPGDDLRGRLHDRDHPLV